MYLSRFEGQISEKNIEIGIIGNDRKFRQAFVINTFFPPNSVVMRCSVRMTILTCLFPYFRVLTPSEIADYLEEVE